METGGESVNLGENRGLSGMNQAIFVGRHQLCESAWVCWVI